MSEQPSTSTAPADDQTRAAGDAQTAGAAGTQGVGATPGTRGQTAGSEALRRPARSQAQQAVRQARRRQTPQGSASWWWIVGAVVVLAFAAYGGWQLIDAALAAIIQHYAG